MRYLEDRTAVRSGVRWHSIVATAIAPLLIACGGNPADLNGSQAGPSPLVLQDTSPGQLTVFVALDMGGYDAASREKTLIDVHLQHGGRPVKFVAGEQITCGGVGLTQFTGSFEGEFTTASIAGNTMDCVYRSGGQSAPLTIGIPPAL